MAINIQNVSLGYNGEKIINNVSISINTGSFCSIIGPNGCGKSTLLKAISRNLKVWKGSIEIYGKKIEDYHTRQLARRMAFLAQSPHIPEQFSVRDMVSYGRFPHTNWFNMLTSKDHEAIDRAMDMTEIKDLADRELNQLSGGERQRVWLAMALAQEAEILLLDEPTTYLDIAHQFQTLELISRLNIKMNRTILMVLHDLNQAARYSDLLFVIKDGELFASGTPDEIITRELLREVFSIETKIIRDKEYNCPFFIPLKGISDKTGNRKIEGGGSL